MRPTAPDSPSPEPRPKRSLETRLLELVEKHPKRAMLAGVIALVWGLSSLVVISFGGGFAVHSTDPIHWTHHPLDRLEGVTQVTARPTETSVHLSICFTLTRNGDLDHAKHHSGPYQVLVEFDRQSPAAVTVPRAEIRDTCIDLEDHQPFPTTSHRNLADSTGLSLLDCTRTATSGDGLVLGCYADPAIGLERHLMPPVRLARVPPHRHTNYDGYLQVPLAWAIDLATAPLFAVFIVMMGLGGVPGTP